MTDEATIYTKALEILDSPGKWIKHALALDTSGKMLTVTELMDEENPPVCFCVVGAMAKANDGAYVADPKVGLHNLIANKGHWSVSEFNDHPSTTYKDVVDILKQALVEVGNITD
jgi:hypothetical protein